MTTIERELACRHFLELRGFLESRWVDLHRTWPEPMPNTVSRYMCRYTAEFLHLLDPSWRVVLGLVDGETHTWNQRPDGWFSPAAGAYR